ncbi:hypothetical protein [Rubritalea halochordaticola]
MKFTMSRSRKNKGRQGAWVTYPRCVVLTLGLWFVGLSGYGLYECSGGGEVPAWLFAVLWGMMGIGVVMLCVGLLGSGKRSQYWMELAGRHEAAILFLILAAPLYYFLKLFERKERS